MLVDHFFDKNAEPKLLEFFQSSRSILLITDPPFGVFMEPLLKSIEKMKERFVATGKKAASFYSMIVLPIYIRKYVLHDNFWMSDYRVCFPVYFLSNILFRSLTTATNCISTPRKPSSGCLPTCPPSASTWDQWTATSSVKSATASSPNATCTVIVAKRVLLSNRASGTTASSATSVSNRSTCTVLSAKDATSTEGAFRSRTNPQPILIFKNCYCYFFVFTCYPFCCFCSVPLPLFVQLNI